VREAPTTPPITVDDYVVRTGARLTETPLTPEEQDVIRAAFRGTVPSRRRRAAA
jgi:hypothetical protein